VYTLASQRPSLVAPAMALLKPGLDSGARGCKLDSTRAKARKIQVAA